MVFDYSVQRSFQESIDVVDIGNTTLRCISPELTEYYMILKTVMGKTNILKFGPVLPDTRIMLPDFEVIYKKIDYKEPKIGKEIDKFINDPYKKINMVEEVTEYEAFLTFPEIQNSFNEV